MHPVLAPANRRLWRDAGTLQLGRSGPAAVVLSGLTEGRRAVLALLDGSRSREQVVAQAAAVGASPGAAEELLALLDGAGLLADAGSDTAALSGLSQQERDRLVPDVAALRLLHGRSVAGVVGRRRQARVLIRGAGRIGAPLSALLAAAGVGTVDVRDDAAVRPEDTGVGGLEHRDIGRSRGLAVRDRLRALAPSVALELRRPDLVVLTEPEDPAPDASLLVLDGLAHLVARVEDQVGVVGPLVLPGRSACLRCLDLTRTGLDPAWPALAAQLGRPAGQHSACDGVLATAVATQAALQILELLAGETTPATLDGTLELTVPGWRWRRRSWPHHPACPCTWERAACRDHRFGPASRPAATRAHRHTVQVADIPKRALSRGAKLATLPIGVAGRATLGLGKRLGGRPAELVAAELQARTAEQLFQVLGQLKGGAMKFGQAMSVFEAALPEDVAAPYRAALTKLQEAAPPLPASTVHKVLGAELGAGWRALFQHFDDIPAAAASIGQVHRAVWADGREVAVKIQYPGAGPALLGDLRQLGRLARVFAVLSPGLDVKPLLAELMARVAEELDYRLEAQSQQAFHEAYDDDPSVYVPAVVAGSERVLVTEWLDGLPLSTIVEHGTQEQRDTSARLLAYFLFSGPVLAGLLHADPHPGNFRLLPDGRLGVIDFGAVNRLPDGSPEPIGRLARLALDGHADQVLEELRTEGFVKSGVEVDAVKVLAYLRPLLDPVAQPSFRFSREWLRGQAMRLGDPRSPAAQLGRQLNLPPSYLLIHRVTLGTIGVLCQLGGEAPFRDLMEQWQPGFAPPARRRDRV